MNTSNAMNTDNNTSTEFYLRSSWLIPVLITACLIVATLWILISLIYYGIKSNKWKTVNLNNHDKLNTGLVYISVVLCCVLCLVRLCLSLGYFSVGFTEERRSQTCNSLFDSIGVMYGLVILSTYTFLWLRQRVFYVNQMLNVKYTKLAKFFSAVSIFVILTCGICILVFSTIPNDHFSSPDGCFYKPDTRLLVGYYVSIVLVVFLGNAVLFGLFSHGLRKAKTNPTMTARSRKTRTRSAEVAMRDFDSGFSSNGESVMGTQRKTQGKKKTRVPTVDLVKIVLKKTLFFAVVSVVCDITLQVLLYFTSVHRRVVTLTFNINAFLNVLFIIFSFVQYKKMLFSPCFYLRRK